MSIVIGLMVLELSLDISYDCAQRLASDTTLRNWQCFFVFFVLVCIILVVAKHFSPKLRDSLIQRWLRSSDFHLLVIKS